MNPARFKSHRIEEVESGQIRDATEIATEYGSDEWDRLKVRLNESSARKLAEVAGVSVRSIKYYRVGREPSSSVKERLVSFFRLDVGTT